MSICLCLCLPLSVTLISNLSTYNRRPDSETSTCAVVLIPLVCNSHGISSSLGPAELRLFPFVPTSISLARPLLFHTRVAPQVPSELFFLQHCSHISQLYTTPKSISVTQKCAVVVPSRHAFCWPPRILRTKSEPLLAPSRVSPASSPSSLLSTPQPARSNFCCSWTGLPSVLLMNSRLHKCRQGPPNTHP